MSKTPEQPGNRLSILINLWNIVESFSFCMSWKCGAKLQTNFVFFCMVFPLPKELWTCKIVGTEKRRQVLFAKAGFWLKTFLFASNRFPFAPSFPVSPYMKKGLQSHGHTLYQTEGPCSSILMLWFMVSWCFLAWLCRIGVPWVQHQRNQQPRKAAATTDKVQQQLQAKRNGDGIARGTWKP